VIVGKSITAEGESKCFSLINSDDTKPKRRVFEVLKSQGMQINQQITFLSDGDDTVRELQLCLNPQAEQRRSNARAQPPRARNTDWPIQVGTKARPRSVAARS
jgi:hypothetical protein